MIICSFLQRKLPVGGLGLVNGGYWAVGTVSYLFPVGDGWARSLVCGGAENTCPQYPVVLEHIEAP